MLKVIKRVLRLSGDLSKRIYASFVFSFIRDAEQILVIDNGKLVQHGKHDELVLQEGIYQKYWNIRQNAKAWKVAQ